MSHQPCLHHSTMKCRDASPVRARASSATAGSQPVLPSSVPQNGALNFEELQSMASQNNLDRPGGLDEKQFVDKFSTRITREGKYQPKVRAVIRLVPSPLPSPPDVHATEQQLLSHVDLLS